MINKFLIKLGLHNILLILGLAGFAGATVEIYTSILFLKSSERAIGEVVKVEMGDLGGSRSPQYHPIFKFKTKEGQEISCTCVSYGSSSSPYAMGEKATIVYDPADPSNAFAIGYFNLFGVSLIILSLSIALLVAGGGYYLTRPFLKMNLQKT